MMKNLFCILSFLGIGHFVFGQMLQHDTATVSGTFSLGGSVNGGNFQKVGLVNTGDFFFNTNKEKFGLQNHTQYTYTKTFGEVSENDLLTRTLFYSRFQKRWYATFIFWVETNKLRELHPLVQAGPSVEYAWLLQKRNSSGISLGATYEHKHFYESTFSDAKYNGSQNITTPRLFVRLHGQDKIGISGIVFTYDIYYMPSLQYSNNYRVHAESSLAVPITKWLNLMTSVNYNYESVVIANVKPNDFFMNYGVSVNF